MTGFLLLLAAFAALRLAELGVSARNRRRMAARGLLAARDPSYPAMVTVHALWLAGGALEALLAPWALLPAPWRWGAGLLLAGALGLRLWAMASLGGHWNTRVMDSGGWGVVARGPYRFVRHPNYAAVILEIAALPLTGGAWVTALAFSLANALVLRARLSAEEAVLEAHPAYREAMGGKPRFVPRLF